MPYLTGHKSQWRTGSYDWHKVDALSVSLAFFGFRFSVVLFGRFPAFLSRSTWAI